MYVLHYNLGNSFKNIDIFLHILNVNAHTVLYVVVWDWSSPLPGYYLVMGVSDWDN